MSDIGEHALLLVGMGRNDALVSLAPRLVLANGTIVVAEAMARGKHGEYRPATLAQRVTYLAQVVGKGVYDCEVVCAPATPSAPLTPGAEVPIINPRRLTEGEVPQWALDLFKKRGWHMPATPAETV